MDKVTVTQADREAAAKWVHAQYGGIPASLIRAGEDDNGLVQAIARHRIEATRQAEEQTKLLREALEEIATSAFGNGPLSRDRDAHTLSMIEKHARQALEATNG